MTKSFLTTAALVIAGSIAANAAWTTANQSQIWMQDTETVDYTYTEETKRTLAPTNTGGSITWRSTGVSNEVNIHCYGFTVDFTKDARYEIEFTVRFDGNPTNGSLPYCNLTLVNTGNDVSLLFGNADNSQARLGVALNKDVTSTPAHESLCSPSTVGSLMYSSNLGGIATGDTYTYKIIFETFSDSNVNDKIYFGVTKSDGTTGYLLAVDSSHLHCGGHQNQVFDDIGFSLKGDAYQGSINSVTNQTLNGQGGVTMLSTNTSFTSWNRTATEKPIPEPSAFGLLAGIGALALVASRRRRK